MKGIKKAIGEYNAAKRVGLAPQIILNRRNGEIHCDVTHGQNWRAYADNAYVNLLNWAHEVGYRLDEIKMATVAELVAAACEEWKER